MNSTVELGTVVDELAAVQAAMAKLEIREAELKSELIGSMEKEVCGTLHKACISFVQPKPGVDYKAVVSFLKVGKDILDRFPTTKASYSRVSLHGL